MIDEHRFAGDPAAIFAAVDKLLAVPTALAWRADGACREHPEVNFYPVRGEESRPAKNVCAACLVRDECRGWALALPERHGIWGGLSERERRRIRGELAVSPRAA